MNKQITEDILKEHFLFFSKSLAQFPDMYVPLVFQENAEVPVHVAYLCPLCLRSYIVALEHGMVEVGELTLDHFPPESVGGTLTILTCKKCNNDAGAQYEGELIRKVSYEASRNGDQDAFIPTKFSADTLVGNYTSFVKKDEQGKLTLDFVSKTIKKGPYLKEWLDQSKVRSDWEVTLTISRPDDKKILKAILKSAYLICFINWGYDFAFSRNASHIRDVLNGKIEYPLSYLSFWFDKSNLPEGIQIPLGLCIIEKPLEMKTFVVNIPLQLNDYTATASVLIPFAGEIGWIKLKEIESYTKEHPIAEVSFTPIVSSVINNVLNGYTSFKMP